MMKIFSIVGLMVSLTVCSVSGCDDGDEIAGISQGTQLNDLSEGELLDLCEHYAWDLIGLKKKACIIPGLAAAAIGGVDFCESAVEECRENVDKTYGSIDDYCRGDYDDNDFEDDEENYDNDMENCDVTVGEADRCFNDLMQMSKNYFDELTCEDGALDLLSEEIGVPDSCVEVMEKCPAIGFF